MTYRRLEKGEIILETDEYDPAHGQYRRKVKVGDQYVVPNGCTECGSDLLVGYGVFVQCTKCDHKLMSG